MLKFLKETFPIDKVIVAIATIIFISIALYMLNKELPKPINPKDCIDNVCPYDKNYKG